MTTPTSDSFTDLPKIPPSDSFTDLPKIPPSESALHSLLLTAGHTPTAAHDIITTKIRHRPLPLFPTTSSLTTPPASTTPSTDARSTRRQSRQSTTSSTRPKPLSAKKRRELGFHRPLADSRFGDFRPLIELWKRYAEELVKGMGSLAAAQRLAGADLHGAVVQVVRCRCVDRVGIKGVVVMERRGAVVVVVEEEEGKQRKGDGERKVEVDAGAQKEKREVKGKKGKKGRGNIRIIPKEHTVLKVEVGEMVMEVALDGMQQRPAERAIKKWKSRSLLYNI
ncbi:hypothetical protein EX30DRAFT_392535 [Ascodesmis nigricans]|uniref:Uncharacterized protein n=1 Tax=Ascodesmis nigricans TaxID=341454 RepID=A0A4S2N737_9PEZI|nr:hypothetical protein EX30DRAFT_392535 [Ascodesmis nigricans]